jgi:PE family
LSFVTTAPELVAAAAHDLAGIGSSLADVTASVAGPTTGVAAAAQDEVSVAIASLFGNFGAEFQAVSAQAQAFHAQFVSAMNGSAAAYLSAEAANAGESLLGSAVTAPAQAVAQALGAPGLIQGVSSFGAAVAAPYQGLVANTVTNLQAINSTFAANPFPFMHQVIANQTGYANTFGSGLLTDLQGFPANVPANIQLAIQGASTFNPGALTQGFINGQVGTGQTVTTSLQNAGNDLMTGAPAFQTGVQAGFGDLLAGNPIGAYNDINHALINLILPGFQDVNVPFADLGSPTAMPAPIIPLGPLGDLAPIFAIPGQMAQSFTNLLAPGSIVAQMAQNTTNVVDVLTNFSSTFNPGNTGINFGAPLQLVFDSLGAPGNALSALNSSAVAFTGALQTGNVSAAAAAVLDAPAEMTNGFLNGSTPVNLPPLTVNLTLFGMNAFSLTSTAQLSLGGLLTPLSPIHVAGGDSVFPGTQIGGLIPGLQSIGTELAQAITPGDL